MVGFVVSGAGEDGAGRVREGAALVWVGCRFVSGGGLGEEVGRWAGQGRARRGLTLELCISDSCTMGDIWSSRSDGAIVGGGR